MPGAIALRGEGPEQVGPREAGQDAGVFGDVEGVIVAEELVVDDGPKDSESRRAKKRSESKPRGGDARHRGGNFKHQTSNFKKTPTWGRGRTGGMGAGHGQKVHSGGRICQF